MTNLRVPGTKGGGTPFHERCEAVPIGMPRTPRGAPIRNKLGPELEKSQRPKGEREMAGGPSVPRCPPRAGPGSARLGCVPGGKENGPEAPRSAPPVRDRPGPELRPGPYVGIDQNEYVADTCGNGGGPPALFHTELTGLFQKFWSSVASSMSEPSLAPAPMLKLNTWRLSVVVAAPISLRSEYRAAFRAPKQI